MPSGRGAKTRSTKNTAKIRCDLPPTRMLANGCFGRAPIPNEVAAGESPSPDARQAVSTGRISSKSPSVFVSGLQLSVANSGRKPHCYQRGGVATPNFKDAYGVSPRNGAGVLTGRTQWNRGVLNSHRNLLRFALISMMRIAVGTSAFLIQLKVSASFDLLTGWFSELFCLGRDVQPIRQDPLLTSSPQIRRLSSRSKVTRTQAATHLLLGWLPRE